MLPQSVLITGTSRGIGLELVRQLSAYPSPPKHIFATCRTPDEAQELQSLSKLHSFIQIIKFDVLEFDNYDKLVQQIEGVVGEKGLNLLVNNADVSGRHSLEDVTPAIMMETFQTGPVAQVMMVKAFLPLLRKAAVRALDVNMSLARAGVITLSSRMGSLQLFDSYSHRPYYPSRATKVAINILTRALARDLEPDGILVMALDPGRVKTRLAAGPESKLTVEECVYNILQTLQKLDKTVHGHHVDLYGQVVPW